MQSHSNFEGEDLRIFQVLEGSANAAVPTNLTWRRNLHDPLVDLGHDVLLVDAGDGRRALREGDATLRGQFSQRLLDSFRREHAKRPFDLAFMYLMDGMVDAGVIDEIRKTGVPTCNFSCNNVHQFELVDELSPHFDLNLYAEKHVGAKFAAVGATAAWWPMASNPSYFRPMSVERTIEVSFVGANYALRGRGIRHLARTGVDVHAYGPGWRIEGPQLRRAALKRHYLALRSLAAVTPDARVRASSALAEHDFQMLLRVQFPDHLHGIVSDDEVVALYSRSHISLGFLEVFDGHDPSAGVLSHLHLREFEAPMSGALYCTGYSDELAEMFEPDEEVAVYRSLDEMLDKVRYLLAHPERANHIRRAGLERALRDHTYHRRFLTLFQQLQLSGY